MGGILQFRHTAIAIAATATLGISTLTGTAYANHHSAASPTVTTSVLSRGARSGALPQSGLPASSVKKQSSAPGSADKFWTSERVRRALANPVAPEGPRTPPMSRPLKQSALPDVALSANAVPPKRSLASAPGEARTSAAQAQEATRSLRAPEPKKWPWAATGILFFETAAGRYGHCTASVITHSNKSSLWTAAHCLYDWAKKRWYKNFAFAPGFAKTAPYGYWDVKRVIVPSVYISKGDFRYSDMGGMVLQPRKGRSIQNTVGAYGYEFRSNSPENDNVASLGYPADGYHRPDSFYSGGAYMRYCYGNTVDASNGNPLDQRLEMDCEMGHGASGGPMVKNLTHGARIVGVNSHRNGDSHGNWTDNHLYSSEHGAYAVSVYKSL
ncbi:trypsin-like serine protease [Streptomyces sp. NPDC059649]|uniref:trypsin-like serine peptidase n=1 Tax=Streptomyces sp. NPDC059649 TaxID=3346895 RepID=UPI0036A47BFA